MFSKSEEAFKVLKELEARVSDELFDRKRQSKSTC